jgi:cytochrome P450
MQMMGDSVEMLARPGNVPADLVVDADIYALDGGETDPQMAWKALDIPGNRGLVWTPRNGGHWIATSAPLIWELFADIERLSARNLSVPPNDSPLKMIPNESDEPEHHYYRKIVLPFVSPKKVRQLTDDVRRLTTDLIDSFHGRGGCEFMAEFARYVPMQIFLSLVDLPGEDREWLVDVADKSVRPKSPEERDESQRQMSAYLGSWIDRRRLDPGDDRLSAIIHGTVGDRPMNELEVLGECMDVMFGGLDTVASMMGFIMKYLATHPADYAMLVRQPEKITLALEEMLRRHGVATVARRVIADIEHEGVTVRSGDMIVLPTCLHGLDESRWPDALTVDFDRRRETHCTFGNGVHNCPGAGLARSEIAIMLQEWVKRIPEFGLDPKSTPLGATGGVNGMIRLDLAWPG